MSDKNSVLLVDLGNTNLKAAIWCGDSQYQAVQGEIDSLPYHSVDKVVFASVRHEEDNLALIETAKQYCEVLQVFTAPEAFGVFCAYQNYQTLGVDRWLAVLAAAQKTNLPAAVVDIGTATTVDLLVDNKHLGGWITPGYTLMKNSLVQNTANVFADDKIEEGLAIGQSTQDCVNFGCAAALYGVLNLLPTYMGEKFGDYVVYVTGRGKGLVRAISNPKVIYWENMVFDGLRRFV